MGSQRTEPDVVRSPPAVYLQVMRIRTWLFFGFLFVSLLEIVLLATVGRWIGLWPTIGLVILSAFIGSWLVAQQGRSTWLALRADVANGSMPTVPIVHGAMILVAGALLLTPGFLTDGIGLLLLVPSVREFLRRWGTSRAAKRWIIVK
jgi:UPF0716 protein FxsA